MHPPNWFPRIGFLIPAVIFAAFVHRGYGIGRKTQRQKAMVRIFRQFLSITFRLLNLAIKSFPVNNRKLKGRRM
jgi:Na+/H+-dicarboxylate symporter